MKEKKTFGTRELVTAAVLLAICLVAQLFKNTSVFITGPVINACLILCILLCGWVPSIILCILTPITYAFITGAPFRVEAAIYPHHSRSTDSESYRGKTAL